MKIEVGDFCLFNPENKLKLKDRSTSTVVISSIERYIFGRDIYNCVSMQTGGIIKCNKNLLLKIPDKSEKDLPIQIRYPDDIPAITQTDIDLMNKLEKLFSKSTLDEDMLTNIKRLKIKLNYYYSIHDC